MNFPGKRALSVFKYSNYLPLCKKNRPIPEKNDDPFLRKMPNRQFDSSNSPGLTLTAGIELIPESLSIFNPGFFCYVFLSESSLGRCWIPHQLELVFFPKSDQELITGVWNTKLWRVKSNKFFQYLVLAWVQHQQLRLVKNRKGVK